MDSAFKVIGIGENEFDRIISSRDAFISITKCLFMCLVSENDGLRYVAAELLQHIANVVHFRDDEVHEDEEVWKTIKGTHVLIDDDGNITKGPEALRNLSKKSGGGSDAMKPLRSDYDFTLDDGLEDFIRKNIGNRRNPGKLYSLYHDTEDSGGDGSVAVEDEYYKTRLSQCSKGLHEISDDESDEILYENTRRSTLDAWFREYNHEVKEALIYQLTQNPEVHNAALNRMYLNYKYQCEYDDVEPMGFEEFLVTPVKMYRGGTGKEYKEASPFSSYTFSKKVAESFTGSEVGQGHEYDPNGVVYEAEIRPIDTYGCVYTNGESEILVPRTIAPNKNRDEADVHDDGVFFAGELNHVKNGEYDVEYPDKKFG